MTIHAFPLRALANTAKDTRNDLSVLLAGASTSRPTGARSGVRPGTPTNTVSLSGFSGTVKPHSGVIDKQTSTTSGPVLYSITANESFTVSAAHASLARIDIVTIRIDDPDEDGSGSPGAAVVYKAGTPAASPVAATPTTAREMVIATIAVPASGGGGPVVSWVAPYAAAAGALIVVRDSAERDALVATYAPTAHAPALIWQIDVARALSSTDGSNWKTLDGRYLWANAAARTAATGMANGDEGYQVDTDVVYRRVDGAWKMWNVSWRDFTTTLAGVTKGTHGTLAKRYSVAEGTADVAILFTLGSDSSVAGPSMDASLPFTWLNAAAAQVTFGRFGVGTYMGMGFASGASISAYALSGSPLGADTFSATAPWGTAFTTNDTIAIRACGEIA